MSWPGSHRPLPGSLASDLLSSPLLASPLFGFAEIPGLGLGRGLGCLVLLLHQLIFLGCHEPQSPEHHVLAQFLLGLVLAPVIRRDLGLEHRFHDPHSQHRHPDPFASGQVDGALDREVIVRRERLAAGQGGMGRARRCRIMCDQPKVSGSGAHRQVSHGNATDLHRERLAALVHVRLGEGMHVGQGRAALLRDHAQQIQGHRREGLRIVQDHVHVRGRLLQRAVRQMSIPRPLAKEETSPSIHGHPSQDAVRDHAHHLRPELGITHQHLAVDPQRRGSRQCDVRHNGH